MTIPILTSTDKIFKQYLTIVNGVLSAEKRLTSLEIDILEKMLYIDYTYRTLPKDKRDILIFHKKTKDKIRESLYNMSTHSFNNVMSKLRRKGMISSRSLMIKVPIKDGRIQIEFKLEINAEENRGNVTGSSQEA